MQIRSKRVLPGAAGTLLLSLLAVGSANAGELSGDVGVVSDYVFRGVSQSDEDPALQAGLSFTFESGFYVGTWASQVDFGTEADFEVDLFAGYGFTIGDSVEADVQVLRYVYPDDGKLNYYELIGSLTFDGLLTATLAYSDDIYNSGRDGWYTSLAYDFGLPHELTLTPQLGYTKFEGGVFGGSGESYVDYSLTLARDFGPVSASLAAIGTNSGGETLFGKLADDRVVLSVSYGF
jgi:uncharacterized protein (TIGR02001 family)